MSDADALLRAILDAPEDDAPRLVYADWLDEQGDSARAAFMRVQIELARLSADDPDRSRLAQTERTLLGANRTAWNEWLPDWVSTQEYRRGFIEWIQCQAADFIAHADEVRSKTPLQGVRLDGRQRIAVAIFRSRALEGLRSLTLSVNVQPLTWDQLANCHYLSRLADLEIRSSSHTAEMVMALVSSSSLPALKSLRLKWCALGDEHTAWLVRHRWTDRLRALDLSNNHIGPEGGLAIAGSPFLEELEYLSLNGNPLFENAQVVEKLRARFGNRVRLQGS
jgi:uncharacterized protein (TIGR02996 family)